MSGEQSKPLTTPVSSDARTPSKSLSGVLGGEEGASLAALIAAVAKRDQAAFHTLYDLTASMVNALALRILANAEDAEEVVADVYMKVWRTAASFDLCRGTPMGWILMITRTVSIDRLRHRIARPQSTTSPSALLVIEADDQNPEESTAGSERRRRIRDAFARLSPEQQEVLSLAYYSGLSHSELAGNLRQPLGTVKTRIRLALRNLRRILEQMR